MTEPSRHGDCGSEWIEPLKERIMKATLTAAVAACLLAGASAPGFAQSKPDGTEQTFTHGESKRCQTMTGAAKEQCDKEEATKTPGPQGGPGAAAGGDSAGGSAQSGRDGRFTHGESKRCETMTGAAKEQCDKQEATK
jgi:hypothetical protein